MVGGQRSTWYYQLQFVSGTIYEEYLDTSDNAEYNSQFGDLFIIWI